MILNTTVAYEENELLFITFYDHKQLYGFSLTRAHETREIELMVSDQSCYPLEDFEMVLEKGKLAVKLPQGTIDPCDGEGEYMIYFAIESSAYSDLVKVFKEMLKDRAGLVVKDL